MAEIPNSYQPEYARKAKPATAEEIALESTYTNPNLHRRIEEDESKPNRDVLGIWDGLHSYRTVDEYVHDEESTTCEIP